MSVENYNGYTVASIDKWSVTSRFFHWCSAVLLFITWGLIQVDESYIGLHKAFGVSVLFFVLARIINRIFTKSPNHLDMPIWQTIIAHLTHLTLYGCMLAMPIAGILMSMYGGRPIDMFGLFQIPVLVTPNRSMARYYNDLHTDIIWPMLWIFTVLHIGGALFHQFVQKDNLIARMK